MLPPPAFTQADWAARDSDRAGSRLHGEPGRTAARGRRRRAHRTGLRFRWRRAARAAGQALREWLLSGAGAGGCAGRGRGEGDQAALRLERRPRFARLGRPQCAGREGRDGAGALSRQAEDLPYYSAAAVMAGEVPADKFTGAIVLVGTTSKGLQDARSTPEAPDFPGVEIHANLLTGILNGEMRSVPAGAEQVEMLLMLVAGLIVVFAVPWRRPVLSVLGIVARGAGRRRDQHGLLVSRAIGGAAGRDAADAAGAAAVEPGQRLPARIARDPQPVRDVRRVCAARTRRADARDRRALFDGRREPRADGAVLRRPRFHVGVRAPAAARAVGADERLPDADDRRHPRPPRHDRQVHRRRDHGVLGRAAAESAASARRGGGGARHAEGDARAGQGLRAARLAAAGHRHRRQYRAR